MKILSEQKLSELRRLTQHLVKGCKTKAEDGTMLYTPDGVASYHALWLRDFSYMAEYASDMIPDWELEACIQFAQRHRRADGWLPDRTYGDGVTCYAAGTLVAPVGKANLDNTPFWIFLIHSLSLRMSDTEFEPLFSMWEPMIFAGLSLIPRAENGLVYNDPFAPHSPYGFTDTIGKTGHLFYESLLLWRSCRMAQALCQKYGLGQAEWYCEQADKIEKSIGLLYDKQNKTFWAADIDCKQLDVWGNAYLLYIGFPVEESVKQGILTWFCENYDAYAYLGQIRHLPKGEYWSRTLIEVAPEEYQNGAYWATATGWVLWCLYQKKPDLAKKLLSEVLTCFEQDGVYECVNQAYRKLNSFVVSATNVYGAVCRIMQEN